MDLILILIIWGVVGYFSSAKKKAQSDRRQKESGDPMPYAPAGKPASQAPAAKSNPGLRSKRARRRQSLWKNGFPAKQRKSSSPRPVWQISGQRQKKPLSRRRSGEKKKKRPRPEKKTPVQGSLTGYVSPEGPKHSQGISHRYGLDDCAPQEAVVSSIAEERDITNQLAQGMIWSQILGKPRSREPYFGRGR